MPTRLSSQIIGSSNICSTVYVCRNTLTRTIVEKSLLTICCPLPDAINELHWNKTLDRDTQWYQKTLTDATKESGRKTLLHQIREFTLVMRVTRY